MKKISAESPKFKTTAEPQTVAPQATAKNQPNTELSEWFRKAYTELHGRDPFLTDLNPNYEPEEL